MMQKRAKIIDKIIAKKRRLKMEDKKKRRRITSGLGVDDLRSSSSFTSGSMASSLLASEITGPRYNLGLAWTLTIGEAEEDDDDDDGVFRAAFTSEHLADVVAAAATGLNAAPSTDDSSSCAATPARGVDTSMSRGRRWALHEPTPSTPWDTRHSSDSNLSTPFWQSSCNNNNRAGNVEWEFTKIVIN